LVELLVALALMALMAALSWRGLDAMVQTQQRLGGRADALLTMQTGLAQWSADLDAMVQQPGLSSLDWDGRGMRIVRRSPADAQEGEGLQVVAWSRAVRPQGSYWMRWQSEPLRRRADLQAAWAQAAQWAQNPGDAERQRADLGGINSRAFDRLTNYLCGQFGGGNILQRAAVITDRCAHTAQNHDFTFCHLSLLEMNRPVEPAR
jgi:hypothetical protein